MAGIMTCLLENKKSANDKSYFLGRQVGADVFLGEYRFAVRVDGERNSAFYVCPAASVSMYAGKAGMFSEKCGGQKEKDLELWESFCYEDVQKAVAWVSLRAEHEPAALVPLVHDRRKIYFIIRYGLTAVQGDGHFLWRLQHKALESYPYIGKLS